MNKKQRVERILEELERAFPDPGIPLKHSDPYTLLIAVLLSANTTDRQVNQVTPQLFARAKRPEEMVELTPKEIQELIRSCGLAPRKAAAIWELSRLLLKRHRGRVPKSFGALEELPGVGHKTASVVLAQAYGVPTFPVDTHIFRCAKRWGLSSGRSVEAVEKDLKRLIPRKKWNKAHLQMIYYARAYCPARGHQVENCPICHLCQIA